MRPRLVCLGNLTFDDVVLPDGIERPGCVGGDALYAVLAARLVAPDAEMVAPVGTDFPAGIVARMEQAGLSVLGLPPRPRPTLRNRVAYHADGSRSWTIYDDDEAFDDLSPGLADIPAAFRSADAFLILGMTLAAQVRLVESIRANTGALVALDTQEDYIAGQEATLRALIARTDIFLPSGVEIERLLGHQDWEKALHEFAAMGPRIVVAKLGAEGCLVFDRTTGRIAAVPAVPATVVDTTGAGDSFCGAFMAALLRDADPVAAARAGVAAASFTVADYGLDALWQARPAAFAERLA